MPNKSLSFNNDKLIINDYRASVSPLSSYLLKCLDWCLPYFLLCFVQRVKVKLAGYTYLARGPSMIKKVVHIQLVLQSINETNFPVQKKAGVTEDGHTILSR